MADRLKRKLAAKRRKKLKSVESGGESGGVSWKIIEGKAEDVLLTLPENSVHALITDPPASINFMAKKWDTDKGGRDAWVAWLADVLAKTRHPLVPGGYSFVWALPRRSHWTGWACETAGYEICDVFHAMFGTGMPKGYLKSKKWKDTHGTGLKPVIEHWWVGRNPLEGATAANLDAYGTGAFNIDACRVGSNAGWSYPNGKGGTPLHHGGFKNIACEATKGRYPPHIALTHAEDCKRTGTKKVKTGKAHRSKSGGVNFGSETRAKPPMDDMTYANADGTEDVENWECSPGCPIGALGDPTRFWPCFQYEPKAPIAEKNAGCEGLKPRDWREGTKSCTPRSGQLYEHVGRKGKDRPNNHPTVKSVKLMRWIIRLICPPGGTVLDPFNGSGTTGVAAVLEGRNYIGIEGGDDDSPYYCEISRRRIRHAVSSLG